MNFGKQRFGPEPSTADKAFKTKPKKQLYRYNHNQILDVLSTFN